MDKNSLSADPTGFGEDYFGCMDSSATNYNPDTFEDDGNCTYIENINDIEFIKCIDSNEIIAPFDCKEAVNIYGCDFPIHGFPNEKLNHMDGYLGIFAV